LPAGQALDTTAVDGGQTIAALRSDSAALTVGRCGPREEFGESLTMRRA
jgi:hypothetical protein